jgi:hypothetical protein
MFSLEKERRQKYCNEVIHALEEYSYRYKRYQINFALALCYCTKEETALAELVDIKRKTDRFLPLEKNLCCVVFDCIDNESSKKAARSLEIQIQEHCEDEECFMRVASSVEYESASIMCNVLFDALEEFLFNANLQKI